MICLNDRKTSLKLLSVTMVAAAFTAFAIAFTGCGGGNTLSTSKPNPTPAATTTVQVNMGDSPSDWMLAFSMNISSMSLTGSNGSATVISSSMPMEMMHLMGTMQPLAMISAPQGTYTGASITISSATVMYMDPNTKKPVQKSISGPISANVTFSSPMTVGSSPMAIGFDFDMAHSVTTDANGNFVMNPVFHVTSGAQGSGGPMDFADGGIQGMMGAVSSVSGNSFTMTSMQAAQSFTFATNSSTTFANGSMGSMANGITVMVDATLQADGSLLATRIQSMMNPSGMMGDGLVTAITGQPATAFTMVMQNGVGAGMMASYFAQGATINIDSNATFRVDQDEVDMSVLPFTPVFDASHMYVGQNVMPVSSSGMMGGGMGGGMMGGGSMAGTITASDLYLEPQGVTGTAGSSIAPNATSTFTLTLPSDSAFATLTGATSVMIFQQSGTTVSGSGTIAGSSSVHCFGLLFFDGGQWKMVASRIGAN
jgi:hypothetical protein